MSFFNMTICWNACNKYFSSDTNLNAFQVLTSSIYIFLVFESHFVKSVCHFPEILWLAQKFVWVFRKMLWKAWTNFGANPRGFPGGASGKELLYQLMKET